MKPWQALVASVRQTRPVVKIALVGKYVELQDAYMSVRESLNHAAIANQVDVEIGWVHSADLEKDKGWDEIQNADGIVVPGGFGSRGVEGKIMAARFARERRVPYLGLCLGMQVMTVEFARHVLQHEDANSTEFDRGTTAPVIDLMIEQRSISDMGGTMRLGLYPCVLQPGSRAAEVYGIDQVEERHRHRFEFNNAYRQEFEGAGMNFSGLSPDRPPCGNRRSRRPPIHDRQPVPSGVPVAPHEAPSPLHGPDQGRQGPQPRIDAIATGSTGCRRAGDPLVHRTGEGLLAPRTQLRYIKGTRLYEWEA